MIKAVLLVIFASFIWAVTDHIDKYMIAGIERSKNNIKVLLVFSTLIAGIVLSPIWLIANNFNVSISPISLISVLFASLAYIVSIFFYYKAIEKNDASIVIVMLQLVPVFSYLLALILFKESLSVREIIGSFIIFLSAIIISIDFSKRNSNKKLKALLIMTISSLCLSTYFILFDIGIRHSSFYSCAFWYQIGFLIMGIILLSLKSFRRPFINAIKKNGKRYVLLNTTNEILNLIADLIVNYANVILPIALVNVLSGFQGAFVFIIGLVGTIILPKYIKEDLRKKVVIQKIICIILGIIGLIILVYK